MPPWKASQPKLTFFYWRVHEQHVDWLTLQEWTHPTHLHEWDPLIYLFSTKLLIGNFGRLYVSQQIFYITHSWRENNWIHTFPKGISAMWNAVSSRIWTRVAVSISYDDNHYTKGTSCLVIPTSWRYSRMTLQLYHSHVALYTQIQILLS